MHSPSGLSLSAIRQYGGGGDSEMRKTNDRLISFEIIINQ